LARIATTFKPTTNYQWLTALLLGQNERGLAFVSRLVKQKITTKNKKKKKQETGTPTLKQTHGQNNKPYQYQECLYKLRNKL